MDVQRRAGSAQGLYRMVAAHVSECLPDASLSRREWEMENSRIEGGNLKRRPFVFQSHSNSECSEYFVDSRRRRRYAVHAREISTAGHRYSQRNSRHIY